MSRRTSKGAEISLFPFLSILVCLIGALVLLIVILTLAQASPQDRDPAELKRAVEASRLAAETKAALTKREQIKDEADKLLGAAAGIDAREEKLIQLRKDFADLAKTADPRNASETLQKRLENMMAQIARMAAEKPPLQKEIEKLMAELAKRQKKPDEKPPPLVVQAGGSGLASQAKLFFVEAAASGITLHREKAAPERISSGSIGTDDAYNKFLTEARRSPNAMVLFLVRPDGAGAYNLAAGWAESDTFKLRTGKLPLPGQGEVDLSQFGIKKKP
jgi:hypothetical protein